MHWYTGIQRSQTYTITWIDGQDRREIRRENTVERLDIRVEGMMHVVPYMTNQSRMAVSPMTQLAQAIHNSRIKATLFALWRVRWA